MLAASFYAIVWSVRIVFLVPNFADVYFEQTGRYVSISLYGSSLTLSNVLTTIYSRRYCGPRSPYRATETPLVYSGRGAQAGDLVDVRSDHHRVAHPR